ncbi:MAG TPA: hypothetical protein VFW19_13975 [Allosphingosinicella sp.]|nr:hypothetical protein [Allosphingosinicella sp.]
MATLTDLYTRIILDTNRDDLGAGGELEQAKIDAVADAIETWADELFWFNRASGTVTTVPNIATAALPAGMRSATIVSYLGAPLRKVPVENLERSFDPANIVKGQPTDWATYLDDLSFYPTPDAAYALVVYGTADLGVPATSNAWTVEGYRLILATAKKILCRGSLRDPDGLALARDEEQEALDKLRRETRRRGAAPRAIELPVNPPAFNIVTG